MAEDFKAVVAKAKPGKLTFKGGKEFKSPAGKKKKSDNKSKAESQADADIWVKVESLADFNGPLFICINGGTKCISVTEAGDIKLAPTPKTAEGKSEPDQIGQVLVAQQLTPGVVFLKTAFGRYISSDKFGIITATREAVGPQEEWTVVLREDGVAFQSKYEKFLKFEEDRNSLRGDNDSVGFTEVFFVRCQSERRAQLLKKTKEAQQISEKELELEQVKKFQTWGGGRMKLSKNDEAELFAAKDSGKLYEALLDRREKTKSDKFCK